MRLKKFLSASMVGVMVLMASPIILNGFDNVAKVEAAKGGGKISFSKSAPKVNLKKTPPAASNSTKTPAASSNSASQSSANESKSVSGNGKEYQPSKNAKDLQNKSSSNEHHAKYWLTFWQYTQKCRILCWWNDDWRFNFQFAGRLWQRLLC